MNVIETVYALLANDGKLFDCVPLQRRTAVVDELFHYI